MSLPLAADHSHTDANANAFDRKPTAPNSPSDGASAYPSPLHTADDTDFSSNTSSLAPSVTTSTTDRTLGDGLNPLYQLQTSDARDPPVSQPAPESAVQVNGHDHDHAMDGWKDTGAAGSGVGVTSLEQEENAGGPSMPPAGVEAAARKLPLGASAEQNADGGVGQGPAERRDATAHTNGVEVSQWVNGDDSDRVELGNEHGALNGHGGHAEMGMPGNDHELLGPGSPPQSVPEPSDSVTVPVTSGHLPMSMDVDQPLTPADDALPTPASMASQSPVPASSAPAPLISSGLVGERAPPPPAMTIEPHQALLTVSPNSLKRPSPGAEIDTVVLQSGAGPQPVGQQGGVGVSYLATGGLGLAAGQDAVEPPSKKLKTENDAAMPGVITASPASVPAHPLPTPNVAVAAPLPPTPRGTYFPSRQASLAPHLQGRMTANRHRFCLSSVRSLKKHRDAHPFNQPVDIVLLKIPDYPKVITKPMDLGTVEKRLLLSKGDGKGGLVTVQPPPAGSENLRPYEWVEEWIDDVRQIWVNCYTYNGPWEVNAISKMARGLEELFDKQLGKMPPELVTPTAGPTAISPGDSPALKKAPMPRRPSIPASAVKADRPKREVAPPIKLQAYAEPSAANGKRRKSSIGGKASKKAVEEIKFAEKVIKELHKKQHEGFTWPFLQPVDYVALNIPDYPKIVKKPIDLGTIRSKLDNGHYRTGSEFEADMRLLLRNCFTYNSPDTPVAIMGRKLEALFNEKWEERPRTRDVSPEEEEEEDEDEDEEDETDARSNQIALLQKQLMTLTSTIQQLQETKPPAKKKKKPKVEPVEAPPKPAKPKAAPKAPNGASAGPSAAKPAKTSPSAPKKPPKPKKARKPADNGERVVSFEMKAELAETIPNIDGSKLEKAVEIIKKGMPHLLADDDKEIELDIDLLDQRTLVKLYDFVVGKKEGEAAKPKKSHVQLGPKKPNRAATGGVARKQLDEDAQAAQIAQLESQLAMFNEPTAQAGGQNAAQAGMGQGGDMASSSSESEDGSDSDSDSDEE